MVCDVLSEDECVDTVSKGENGVGFIVWGFDERSYSMWCERIGRYQVMVRYDVSSWCIMRY